MRTDPTLSVTGIYASDYDRIVKPHQRFLIPNYFIHYWVRELGPSLAWVVVALQQACWRNDDDRCTISQQSLADEIGVTRETVGRLLRHPMRHWLIPTIDDKVNNTYTPNAYTVYLTPPLTPTHLHGFRQYLASTCPDRTAATVDAALHTLLDRKSRDAFAVIEEFADSDKSSNCYTKTTSLANIIHQFVPDAQSKSLTALADRVQTHLTAMGSTVCRQFFRLNWVPQLGPALSWLVMAMRARCYYNPDTGELRDTVTWTKKDLAATIGQSSESLRKGLLDRNDFAHHFFQITDKTTRTITVRVALASEPLPSQTAAEFWSLQPKNLYKKAGNIAHVKSQTRKNIACQTGNLSHVAQQTQKPRTSEPSNPEICHTFKVLDSSIPMESIQSIPDPLSCAKDSTAASIWQQALDRLTLQMPKATFNAWLKPTQAHTFNGHTLLVKVANPQAQAWLTHQLMPHIQRSVNDVVGKTVNVQFEVDAMDN